MEVKHAAKIPHSLPINHTNLAARAFTRRTSDNWSRTAYCLPMHPCANTSLTVGQVRSLIGLSTV